MTTISQFAPLETDYITHLNQLVDAVNDAVDDVAGIEAGAAFLGTSTTSTSIATGSKIFTVTETNRAWAVGAVLRVAVTASPGSNYLIGTVTAYAGTSLTLDITSAFGSGTHAAWSIGLEGVGFYGGTLASALNEKQGADIASASTVDLSAATGNAVSITGTTTITALGTLAAGAERVLRFAGVLTFTHHATSLILPGGANITTAAGDVAVMRSLGGGNWYCVSYQRANGQALATAAGTVAVPRRQTVLAGGALSGVANFLSAGSGLVVSVAATSVPITIAFAAGHGSSGAVDYVGRVTADTTISGLTDNTTNYLYADYNAGTVTLGTTTTAPVYAWGGSAATTNGLHTFVVDKMSMYLGNGSAAPAVYRVFLGHAITSGGSVTSVTTYALRGEYVSGRVALPASSSSASFAAAMGTALGVHVTVAAICTSTESNYAVGDTVLTPMTYNGNGSSTFYPVCPVSFNDGANSVRINAGAGGFLGADKTGAVAFVFTPAKWDLQITVTRGW